jgi:hypothetical protein
LASAVDLFGPPQKDVAFGQQPGELVQALEQRLSPWVSQVGTGLREWIGAVAEDPNCRVIGARRAAKWFQNYLRGVADKLADAKKRFARETATPLSVLTGVDLPKGKSRTPHDLHNAFLLYCKLRLFELAAQRAAQITHALQSHVVASHDILVDLQRELDHLASQFPIADECEQSASPVGEGEKTSVRDSMALQFRSNEAELAHEVAERLNETLFKEQGGFQTAVAAGGEKRQQLMAAIRGAARQAALSKAQSIDLASMLLKNDSGESPLAKYLEQARPWLERCGGRRRLVFVMPQNLTDQYSAANLAAQLGSGVFGQLPAVVPGSAGDLDLLIELGDISLPHAAAHLLGFRRDLAEAATRLMTRCDVTWTPVFAF